MRDDHGFTLVEVCIAILLLGLMLLGISVMPRMIRVARERYEQHVVASRLAESYIEKYRETVFTSIAVPATNPETVTKNGINYTCFVVIEDCKLSTYSGTATNPQSMSEVAPKANAGDTVNFKKITIKVSWNNDALKEERQAVICSR